MIRKLLPQLSFLLVNIGLWAPLAAMAQCVPEPGTKETMEKCDE